MMTNCQSDSEGGHDKIMSLMLKSRTLLSFTGLNLEFIWKPSPELIMKLNSSDPIKKKLIIKI